MMTADTMPEVAIWEAVKRVPAYSFFRFNHVDQSAWQDGPEPGGRFWFYKGGGGIEDIPLAKCRLGGYDGAEAELLAVADTHNARIWSRYYGEMEWQWTTGQHSDVEHYIVLPD